MRVLRIENDNGEGPYRACNCFNFYNVAYNYERNNLQPAPWDDGLNNFPSSFIFGFASDDQLLTWFDLQICEYEWQHFVEQNFYIVEYEAQEVMQGDRQIAFAPHSARRVSKLPIKELVS